MPGSDCAATGILSVGERGQAGGAWHDWLIAEVLRREAAELIAGPTEAPTPEAKAGPTPKTE